MNYTIGIILFGAIATTYFEVRSARKSRIRAKMLDAWPQFEELYISALQSGISIQESFRYVGDFEIGPVTEPVRLMLEHLDRFSDFEGALSVFTKTSAIEPADIFVEIVWLSDRFGGNGLAAALETHVSDVRRNLNLGREISARQSSIKSVAIIGLLAPWALVGVLSFNPQNRVAYASDSGSLVLLAGFAVSLLAFRMMVAVGKPHQFTRVFGAQFV